MDKEKIIVETICFSEEDLRVRGYFEKEKRYGLRPSDFMILSGNGSDLEEWAKYFLSLSIGILLTIVGKVISFMAEFNYSNRRQELTINIESWECICLTIAVFIYITLSVLSRTRINKSKKKKLIEEIRHFFDEK